MVEQSRGKSLLGGDGDDAAATARRTLFESDRSATAEPNVIVVSDQAAKPAAQRAPGLTPEPTLDVADEELEVKKRVNPWLALLWVAGLGLVALSAWGQMNYTQDLYFGPRNGGDLAAFSALAAFGALAPSLVLGGIVLIGIAIAIHALAWMKRDSR